MSDKPKFHDTKTVEVEQPLGEILGDLRAELQAINRKLGLLQLLAIICALVYFFK